MKSVKRARLHVNSKEFSAYFGEHLKLWIYLVINFKAANMIQLLIMITSSYSITGYIQHQLFASYTFTMHYDILY